MTLLSQRPQRQLIFLMNQEKAEAMGTERKEDKVKEQAHYLLSGETGQVFLR